MSDRRVVAVILGIVFLCGPSVVTMKVIGRQAFARGPKAVPTPVAATAPQYLPFAAGRMVRVNQGNAQRPTHYTVWDRYGWDFGLAYGEPALLGLPGVVARVYGGCDPLHSWECNGGYGNNVAVRASDGTCVRYMHLKTIAGQALALGATVGTVGSSGSSTGAHLHYQREDCRTGVAIASSFVEAGVPQTGWVVMSRLHPGR